MKRRTDSSQLTEKPDDENCKTGKWPRCGPNFAITQSLRVCGWVNIGHTATTARSCLTTDAIAATSQEARPDIKDHPEFGDIGNRMVQEWESSNTLLRA
jgi:hypothetical protein